MTYEIDMTSMFVYENTLSSKERAALLQVRDQLRSGRLPYLLSGDLDRKGLESCRYFNMGIEFNTQHSCGTVGCIGGWMTHILYPAADEEQIQHEMTCLMRREPILEELFYPSNRADYGLITPEQAVKAINRCLAGYEPWP